MMLRLYPESLGRLDPTASFIVFGEAPISVTDVKMNVAFIITTGDAG
jgi:hypothetical protein